MTTTLSPGQIQGRGLGVQLRRPEAGAQEVASPPGGLRDPWPQMLPPPAPPALPPPPPAGSDAQASSVPTFPGFSGRCSFPPAPPLPACLPQGPGDSPPPRPTHAPKITAQRHRTLQARRRCTATAAGTQGERTEDKRALQSPWPRSPATHVHLSPRGPGRTAGAFLGPPCPRQLLGPLGPSSCRLLEEALSPLPQCPS